MCRSLSAMESVISWYMTPYSPIKFTGVSEERNCLHIQSRRMNQVSREILCYLAYSLTLKIKAVRSSETSLNPTCLWAVTL
jgi:hypothetical protein